MELFNNELERYRKLLRIRHGLVLPNIILGNTSAISASVIEHLSSYKRILVVADSQSFAAAGHLIKGVLPDENEIFYQLFEANAKPTMENALYIMQIANEVNADAILSIGSGSITDLCKLVAHERALPLYMVATAASMNGYTSITASIIHDGLKQSFHTFLAKTIFIDAEVLKTSPERMAQAGAADALASKAAMLDWKLSHLLLDTKYHQELEEFTRPRESLIETLLLQGLGMTYAAISSPASGAEHMLAHVVEMMEPAEAEGLLHGEMIAHTLPLCALHQAKLLTSTNPPTLAPSVNLANLSEVFGQSWQVLEPACEVKQKTLDAVRSDVNERLQANWASWREELQALLISEQELQSIAKIAQNSKIRKVSKHWLPYTRFTRNRFTSLDLTLE